MEGLYQLHSFIDGYSKPHTADANTFFEHDLPQQFKAFRVKLVSSPLEEAKKQIQDLQSKLEELNKSRSDSALELEKTVTLKDVKILELTT
jgi:hypothetical protein